MRCCYFVFYSYGDITKYILHTTSFVSLEEVKNYKALQSYKYFTAGWILNTDGNVLQIVA